MSKLTKRQEKKRQLRQRERDNKNPAKLAYHGNKYRTEALVKPLMQTETAILEAYIITGRRLTDFDVRQALVSLIAQLRRPMVAADTATSGEALPANAEPSANQKSDADIIVDLVQIRWCTMREAGEHPGRDNLIGIVRTILASVETRKSADAQSRNYLRFIEKFLGEMGVDVVRVRAPDAQLDLAP